MHFAPRFYRMALRRRTYPLIAEDSYCAAPDECATADVLFVGAGINLSCVGYVLAQARSVLPQDLRVVVLDAGPLDLRTHLGNTRIPRYHFLKADLNRIGGRLALWGLSTPRPRPDSGPDRVSRAVGPCCGRRDPRRGPDRRDGRRPRVPG